MSFSEITLGWSGAHPSAMAIKTIENAKRMTPPNGKRRHAGPIAFECNRDDQPALPGASGSTIGVHEMSRPGSRDSREKAQEAQKEPDQRELLMSADS